MDYELRPITPDEFTAFLTADNLAFNGSPPTDEDIVRLRSIFNFERSLAAFDGADIVATSGNISFRLTVPGPAVVPAAGVTWVSVLPTHRRRGLLRAIMAGLLDDAVSRGEPLAILYASESIIYGRFGFGLASSAASLEIETRHARLAFTPSEEGRIVFLMPDRARTVLPPLYDRIRRQTNGAIDRGEGWWRLWADDPERHRDGWSSRFCLVYERDDGTPEGYATYRAKRHWEDGGPAHVIEVGDLMALTAEARAALWRTLLSLDLVAKVQTFNSPVDEPLRWMLADPRRLRTTRVADGIWVRILDVSAALAARRYDAEGTLVLEVTDTFRPETAGCYRLNGSRDGAECRRTSQQADISLSIADLGAAYLGGVPLSTLAQAGRVQERVPGALRRADAMFTTTPAPWATTDF